MAGDTVVLEQRGVWRSPETGDVTGDKTLASLYRIEANRVVRFARFDHLGAALAAGGLTAADRAS